MEEEKHVISCIQCTNNGCESVNSESLEVEKRISVSSLAAPLRARIAKEVINYNLALFIQEG